MASRASSGQLARSNWPDIDSPVPMLGFAISLEPEEYLAARLLRKEHAQFQNKQLVLRYLRHVVRTCPWTCIFDIVVTGHVFGYDCDFVIAIASQLQGGCET